MSRARKLAMQKYVFHSVTERNSAARPRTRRRDTAISKPKLKRRIQTMENLNRFPRSRWYFWCKHGFKNDNAKNVHVYCRTPSRFRISI